MKLSAGLACALLACCGGGGAQPPGATDAGATPFDGAAIGPDAGADAPAVDAGLPARVRIMAANLTSGTQQSYELPGIHIFQGLAPDIVMIQELNYAGGPLRSLVDTAFGASFSFFVEPRTGGIPNGVVSRYPILASGVWADASVSDRAFVYARIDVPGPVDLWAVSVHLLTSGATERATEAMQLAGYVQSNVPAGDYLVIAGDFNTDTTNEQALQDLSSEVVVTPPYPADQMGNAFTSINRNHPHDWVLPSPGLEARATPVTIGAASFAAGLVFDSRVYAPLGDVAPVVATDSGAAGMQHMAVVRDFLLGG
jgi:endonuclease/exonuclease/phosphatase family metal-dependent hydrolase